MTEQKNDPVPSQIEKGYGAVANGKDYQNGAGSYHLMVPQSHPRGGKNLHNSLNSVSSQWERENPDLGDGGFRAFVLAFMDGFVTTLCFVLTVGSATENVVLFAGMVSGFAGIFSMAIGEWISMQLQNDGFMRAYPSNAATKIKAVLAEKYSISAKTVDMLLADLKKAADAQDKLVDFWSRVDLGIDPDELGGKPWKAVIMCAVGYGAGALVPLASWYLGGIWHQGFYGCLIFSFIMTIVVGGALSNFTAHHWCYTIIRQIAVTFIAAGCVYIFSINMPAGL